MVHRHSEGRQAAAVMSNQEEIVVSHPPHQLHQSRRLRLFRRVAAVRRVWRYVGLAEARNVRAGDGKRWCQKVSYFPPGHVGPRVPVQEKKSGTATPDANPNVTRANVNRLQFEATEGHLYHL